MGKIAEKILALPLDERVEKLKATIRELDKRELFNMGTWSEVQETSYGCGTVRCIGGTIQHMMGFRKNEPSSAYVGSYLNLTELATDALFYPHVDNMRWEDISTEDALKAIDVAVEATKEDPYTASSRIREFWKVVDTKYKEQNDNACVVELVDAPDLESGS